jgi:hypothetical protein
MEEVAAIADAIRYTHIHPYAIEIERRAAGHGI